VDLDGDGRCDILSGSYSRMEKAMAGLFQALWGQPDGTFKKAAPLCGTDGKPLIIPVKGDDWIKNICTRPFAVDWDGDGHLDLVTGNFFGTFYLFKGQGKGQFLPQPEEMKAGDAPLRIQGYHSDPFVVDWDGDGDFDVLSGFQWAENLAGAGKPPRLKPFRTLIQHGPQLGYGEILREEDLKEPQSCTRIWVDDVNGDGKLDILVGDLVTLISPADHVTEKKFKKKFGDWQKAVTKAASQLNSNPQDQEGRREALTRYRNLYGQRTEFMKEDRTGFVWLYLHE
jgi:FG-GAP-like repeat